MRTLISILILSSLLIGQFGKVEVTVDDRLLRASERQKVSSIRDEVSRFFGGQLWDDKFQGLNIPLNIFLFIFKSSKLNSRSGLICKKYLVLILSTA